ncbi:MAG: hypothetical protein K0R65_734 [Crocinitomicaceae bacterium]|jgi:hypothetical protein|nr:hypothetical protein [Crocinitomicaceae bacterium]
MKVCLNILFVFLAGVAISQTDSLLFKREQQLKTYLNALRASKTPEEKNKNNEIFKSYLLETIQIDGAFSYPFSELKTLGSIKSPDNAFRLFNWNIEQEDRSNKYFCYILRFDEKKKEWKTIELMDNSAHMLQRSDEILDEKNWYGALYYKIIPIEKSNKTLYTILGWDGNPATNAKMVDVLSFSGNKVKLGSPIFKMNDGLHKRLYFEHSKKAFMSLNFDEARQRIVYDHLSPETPNLVGFYEYYVPDFSYDELYFKNNKWVVQEDVVGINNKGEKSYTLQHINPKNGEVVSKEVKNNWIDPSDKNAPAGGNTHVASVPESEKGDKVSTDKTQPVPNADQTPKISKKQRKNEFSMNPYYIKKGKRRH